MTKIEYMRYQFSNDNSDARDVNRSGDTSSTCEGYISIFGSILQSDGGNDEDVSHKSRMSEIATSI
jgi:hypothetical protein